MKKYTYDSGYSQDGGMEPYAGDGTEFYLAPDVDARITELSDAWRHAKWRIAELEEALRALAIAGGDDDPCFCDDAYDMSKHSPECENARLVLKSVL